MAQLSETILRGESFVARFSGVRDLIAWHGMPLFISLLQSLSMARSFWAHFKPRQKHGPAAAHMTVVVIISDY